MSRATEVAELVREFNDAREQGTTTETGAWTTRIGLIEEWVKRDGLEPPDNVRRLFQKARTSRLQLAATELEDLPVVDRKEAGLAEGGWTLGFALNMHEGGWLPGYNIEVKESNGWATVGIKYADGRLETHPCPPGRWAHCDADGNPSMPWAWEE